VVDFISILFWKYFSKILVKILGSKSILKEIYKQKAWRSLAHFSLYYFVFIYEDIFGKTS
jgi:hypothetical protein